MTHANTKPITVVSSEPIDTVELEVLDGPSAGKSLRTTVDDATIGSASNNMLILDDPSVSRYHVWLRASPEGIELVDRGSTNGTYLGNVRVDRGWIPSGSVLRLGRSRVRVTQGRGASVDLYDGTELAGLYGATVAMRRLMLEVAQASTSAAPVLILGESGTGKEVVARALHDLGDARKPFVTVDCGALPGALVASELFGHERGAFTGAERARKGAFELADGGTLFLDEVGELPIEHQPALLGALERRRFKRVGGTSEIAVNVRVIAATHRDLPRSVNEGAFRLDLYYRLAVVMLRVPALRERAADVPELARRFAETVGETTRFERCFPPDVLERLQRAPWPGNVRELRNYVESALVMGQLREVPRADATGSGHESSPETAIPERLLRMPYHDARSLLVRAHERQALELWLKEAGGNVSLAARKMGLHRAHLYTLLARHGMLGEGKD